MTCLNFEDMGEYIGRKYKAIEYLNSDGIHKI